MKSHISAAQAPRNFNRVRDRGESFVVERRNKPICEIVPAKPPRFSGAVLVKLLGSLPKPDEDFLTVVEKTVTNQPPVAKSGWQR